MPYSTQATYIKRSIALAKKFKFVGMFIWFVYQDDPGQPWESGIYTHDRLREGPVAVAVLVESRAPSTCGTPSTRSGAGRVPARHARSAQVLREQHRRHARSS